jgi:peptidoglycan/xylan/chitin deacetylase (PgdA/CDA1 family)
MRPFLRAVFFVMLVLASPARADRAALQAACFAAADLRAQPGEAAIRRNVRALNVHPPTEPQASRAAVPAHLAGAIRRVQLPAGKKLVALTFDFCELAGEITGYDGAIIDILRANGVKATLFAGGKWMASHAVRTHQLMADPLFEIGTHGWAHRNTRLITGAALKAEIEGPSVLYSRLRGGLAQAQCAAPHRAGLDSIAQTVGLFRFPFGACNREGLAAAAAAGLLAIQWDVSTGDPAPTQSARAIVDLIVRQTKPGSIVLMHGNGRGRHTAEALPSAIAKLRALGYQFVTVSELLVAGRPEITQTCFDSRPGDTDRYDVLFGAKRGDDAAAVRPTLPR